MSPLIARREAARFELVGQFLGRDLGAREDDHAVEGFGLEDAGERVELVQAADQPVALADVLRGLGRGLDLDLGRIFQVGLGDARIDSGMVAENSAIWRSTASSAGFSRHRR
jgi:hypothetical protein